MSEKRPRHLLSLFHGGSPYEDWQLHNARARRFYVLNLRHVVSQLGLQHTNAGPYFQAATRILQEETTWPTEIVGGYPISVDFGVSKVQIYPKAASEPKFIAKAAGVILAMEVAGATLRPDFDPYAYLRIVPAYYFVDQLDLEMVERVKAAFARQRGGSFAEFFRNETGQADPRLLDDLAKGHCVTLDAATTILAALQPLVAPDHVLGPVRPAGDPKTVAYKLGSRDAAPLPFAPPFTPPDELAPLAAAASS